jgi:hypothetical protein
MRVFALALFANLLAASGLHAIRSDASGYSADALVQLLEQRLESFDAPTPGALDLFFFSVRLRQKLTPAEEAIFAEGLAPFRRILKSQPELSYLELGGMVGSQTVALRIMAMGEFLGYWKVMSPMVVMPDVGRETHKMLAENGYITIMEESDVPDGGGCHDELL